MLYSAVHWPKEGLVQEFIDGVTSYIFKILRASDIYLAFDRYVGSSIKSATRLQRIGNIKRSHKITMETPLPTKETSLSSNKTKESLIELIAGELINRFNKSFENSNKKLIITSKSEFPKQSQNGTTITRYDLKTTFDEADYIIPHQVVTAFQEGNHTIKVISADTDVFCISLLCHVYKVMNMDADVLLEDFHTDKNIISIRKSVEKNDSLISSLLSAHALTGCDTVPMMFGVGKGKMIKVLQRFPLTYLGNVDATEHDYINEGKLFVAKCYGMTNLFGPGQNGAN